MQRIPKYFCYMSCVAFIIVSATLLFCCSVTALPGSLTLALTGSERPGRVVDSYDGIEDKEILIITDAHCNPYAQRNIAQLISLFVDGKSNMLVAYEGAAGALAIDDIQSFPLAEVRNDVAYHFLLQGKINGVEYYRLMQNSGRSAVPVTMGVEEPGLYRANIAAYRACLGDSSAVAHCVDALSEQIYLKAEQICSDRQMLFLRMSRAVHTGEISFIQYCTYLLTSAEEYHCAIDRYPNFALLRQAEAYKRQLDLPGVEQERTQALALIESPETVDALTDLYERIKRADATPDEYYRALDVALQAASVDISPFKNLSRYIRYVRLTDSIDQAKLFDEEAACTDLVAHAVLNDPDSYALYECCKRLHIVTKVLALDVSANEYERFMSGQSHYSKKYFVQFCEKYDIPTDWDIAVLEHAVSSVRTYYETAEKRSVVMTDNLLTDMDMEGYRKACLVVGGFHADGITRILKQRLISYTVISPAMSSHGYRELYRARLEQTLDPFEQLIQNSYEQIDIQHNNTSPATDTLAVASLLSGHALLDTGAARVFRAEFKSLMTAAAIKALEQTGYYQLPELQKRVEQLLMAQWGIEHFKPLQYITLYRGLSGEMIAEIGINDKKYTFTYSSDTEDAGTLRPFFAHTPDRILGQFTLDPLTVSVREGSFLEYDAEHALAEDLLRALTHAPQRMDELQARYADKADLLNRVLLKWEQWNVTLMTTELYGAEGEIDILTLKPLMMDIVTAASVLADSLDTPSDVQENLPDSVKQALARNRITNLQVDRSVPLPVLVDILAKVALNRAADEIEYTASTETTLFSAQVIDTAQSAGRTLVARATPHTDRPYDAQRRAATLAELYDTPELLGELLDDTPGRTYVSLDGADRTEKPSFVDDIVRVRHDTIDALMRFIGDPDTFNTRPKAVMFDMDGTISERLVDSFLPIPQEIIDAMKYCMERGIDVVLITGQPYSKVKGRFVDRFEPNARERLHVYTNNGAFATGFDKDGTERIYYETKLEKLFPENGFEQFKTRLREIVAAHDVDDYQLRLDPGLVTVGLSAKYPDSLRTQIYQEIVEELKQSGIRLNASIAGHYSIDISAMDKGDAINDFVKNRVPVAPSDMLCFGDSYDGNDEPMSQAALKSAHFHVGHPIDSNLKPSNVIVSDIFGPAGTNAVLQRLITMMHTLVDNGFNVHGAERAALIYKNMETYYAYHRLFSAQTHPSELPEKTILPIWFSTNEKQWEEPIEMLEDSSFNDTFIGAGASGVNLSYLAAAQPEQAIVLDYNPVITQFFIPLRTALITLAETRIDYISMLSAKPVIRQQRDGVMYYKNIPRSGSEQMEISEHASLEEILEFFKNARGSAEYRDNHIAIIKNFFPENIRSYVAPMWHVINSFHRGFGHLPMLQAMLDADNRAGRAVTWLSNEERFDRVRTFVSAGNLYGAEANWSGEEIAGVAANLTAQGRTVDIVYLSNILDKIAVMTSFRNDPRISARYFANIASFPKSDRTRVLADPSLQKYQIDDTEPFDQSSYQRKYVNTMNPKTIKALFAQPDDTVLSNRAESGFEELILNLLRRQQRPDLADFYAHAEPWQRTMMLMDIAQQVRQRWLQIRTKIRTNVPLSGDDLQQALELENLFGYALKDMEKVFDRFDQPEQFIMQILLTPYDIGRYMLPLTASYLSAQVVESVEVFANDPMVVLVDAGIAADTVNSISIAQGQTLALYKAEQRRSNRRRVLVYAVATDPISPAALRKQLDDALYTQGQSAELFDDVIALGYLPETTPDMSAMQQTLLTYLTDTLHVHRLELGERVTVIAHEASTLADLALTAGLAARELSVDEQPGDTNLPASGIVLIDVLRSIGSDSLPADLEIVSVRTTIATTPAEQGFNELLSLFRKIYEQYHILSQTGTPTYGDLIEALNRARMEGTLSRAEANFLRIADEMSQRFVAYLDDPLTEAELPAVVVRMLNPVFSTTQKRVLQNLFMHQMQTLILAQIVAVHHTIAHTPLTVGTIMNRLQAHPSVNVRSIAGQLEVDVPSRPIGEGLNRSIQHQRAIDTAA